MSQSINLQIPCKQCSWLFCLLEYLQVVQSALDEVDPKCSTEISTATSAIQNMLTTDAGRAHLKSLFR